MFKYCVYENLIKVRERVYRKLRDIENIRSLIGKQMHPTYSALLKLYFSAKVKHIGYTKRKHSIYYTSDKVQDLQNRIRAAKNVFLKTQSDLSLFLLRQLQKLLVDQYKSDETERFNLWLAKLNRLDYKGRTRLFYRSLRWRENDNPTTGPVINKTGKLSRSWNECLMNWKNFYARLYASKSIISRYHSREHDATLDKPFTYEELVLVIASLREHKAHGGDYITANDMIILIHADPEDPSFAEDNRFLLRYILSVINTFWDKEKVPPVLKMSIIVPILKKADSDATNPTNYRPISLLSTLMKIYEGLIKRRLVSKLESQRLLSPIQAAYRKGRSTCDHLLLLQELFLGHRFSKGAQKRSLYVCFMDLIKAFDTVSRKILFRKLRALGIQGKMLRVITDLYTKNKARIQVGSYLSSEFEINKGVMQGSKLGPILFIIFINDLLNDLHNSRLGAQIAYQIISALGFADDIVLISDDPSKLHQLISLCDNWARKIKCPSIWTNAM